MASFNESYLHCVVRSLTWKATDNKLPSASGCSIVNGPPFGVVRCASHRLWYILLVDRQRVHVSSFSFNVEIMMPRIVIDWGAIHRSFSVANISSILGWKIYIPYEVSTSSQKPYTGRPMLTYWGIDFATIAVYFHFINSLRYSSKIFISFHSNIDPLHSYFASNLSTGHECYVESGVNDNASFVGGG